MLAAHQPSNTTECWLLHLTGGVTIAIALNQVAELLGETTRHPVPLAPFYCNQVIVWRETLIPLIDFQHQKPEIDEASAPRIMVVKFSHGDTETNFLGFAVSSIEKSSLSDSNVISTSLSPQWQSQPFASSIQSVCLMGEQTVVILNMDHLVHHLRS